MLTRLITAVRANAVACIALAVAVAGGGGYAIAATSTPKTITVCANKKTGLIYYAKRGRCNRQQTKLAWNQRGVPGATGPQGPAGAAAVNAWAIVGDSGLIAAGQGLSVQHTATGTYVVTAAACAGKVTAPVVSPSDSNPPAGQAAGAFPELENAVRPAANSG